MNEEWVRAIDQKKGSGFVYNVKDTTKVITYNSKLYTECVINLLKAHRLSEGDATRLLLFKKTLAVYVAGYSE